MSVYKLDALRLGKYKMALGDEAGEIFYHLVDEYYSCQSRWQEYKELFATTRERISLLNESTSYFFSMIQSILLDDILLSICRMNDPSSSFGKANLSFSHFQDLMTEMGCEDLSRLVEKAKRNVNPIKYIRNTRLGHNDLNTIIKERSMYLELPELENALSNLFQIINHVYFSYLHEDIINEMTPSSSGSISLMLILRDGIRYRNSILDKVARNEPIDFDEINLPPI